ncbi:MAG: glycosyltransferase family 39 protein [bacterium]|nr:glycosyltransferase family 39 protein [Candidatus Margulisiibacteriota bacterium]
MSTPRQTLVDLTKKQRYNLPALKRDYFTSGLLIVLIATLLASGIIFANHILHGDAFTIEEAQHGLYGLWIWRDLRSFDLVSFIYDTNRQMVWPFLHSWLLAGYFLVFGANYIAARLLSLAFFFVSVVLIYLLSNKLCAEKGPRVGIIAVFLALTSPMMLQFAAQNMLEGLGGLLFMACAYLYLISEERKITIEYILFIMLLGISIYVNYLYAYLLIPAFFVLTLMKLMPIIVGALRLRKQGEKYAVRFIWWSYRKVITLSIFLFLGGLWFSFSFSRKVFLLFTSIFRYSGGEMLYGLENLIYYPKVIISNLSFSPWFGFLMVISLLLPMIAARYRGLNSLYVYVWTVLVLLVLTVPTKAPQMIYVIVPFIYVIFAGLVVYVIDELFGSRKKLAMGFVMLLLLPALLSLPRITPLFFPEQSEHNLVDVLDYFAASVPADAKKVVMFHLKRLNVDGLKFHLRDWENTIVDGLDPREGFGDSSEVYYLAIQLDEGSRYQRAVVDDSVIYSNRLLLEKEQNGEIALHSSTRFEDIGLTAQVFRSIMANN